MHIRLFQRGFTLIELLVVVALIGIIASLVMVALEESRQKSRNAARATQVREYQKVFNMHYSDHGYYPIANGQTATASACLGDFPTDRCWNNIPERAWLVNAMTPRYMAQIPQGESTIFGNNNTGMLYTYTQYGKSYSVSYFMEGADRDCLVDGTTSTQVNGDTQCTLTVVP